MAWIPNVNPNELITSSWGNTIRDHVVNTFTDSTARNAAIPSPQTGMTCWLSTPKFFQVYDGSTWQTVPGAGVNPVSYSEWTGGSGDVGATPAYTGLTAAFVAVGGRKVYITGMMTFTQKTVDSNAVNVYVKEGATTVTQTNQAIRAATYATIPFGRVVTPTAGTHNYDVYFSSDQGTASIISTGAFAAHILVRDIGT